ncbi:hypothetical protein [Natronomonas salsuginis]|uniref:Uncharacterized protein n=1 Tax=Natronomonas salsuginis TaxID=2217661 RepID=A0A4U5JFK2_9EURY|nr:hypothetical protein [Natronomonas salsuginis]TKR27974.1 hypothetical protein DM868_02525 [Natronomonas salsuginis]
MPEQNSTSRADDSEHVRTHGYGSNRQSRSFVESLDPEDVFENPARPRRKEAISGLVDAGFLSSLEAEAYIRYVIEGQRGVEERSFSLSSVESAKTKIASARESFAILDAYRSPKAPDKCSKCGSDLGEVWTANLEEVSLCLDCADVERPELR